MEDKRHQDPEAPSGLAHALKRLDTKSVGIPPSVDDAILSAARQRLGKGPSLGWWAHLRGWSNWIKVPALAAACVLLVFMAKAFIDGPASRFVPEDINRDGKIDILDAFALARELQSGRSPARNLDLNGDGVVDRHDADIIAAEAVSLERKGGRL